MLLRILLALLFLPSATLCYGTPSLPYLKLFVTNGDPKHQEFVQLINSAQKKINLTVFRLSDPDVVDALIAAKKRHVDVRVILCRSGMKMERYKEAAKKMQDAGLDVRSSSEKFSITHSKAMTIDDTSAVISSMNLVRYDHPIRDYGVILINPQIIDEMNTVFESDWKNAGEGTGYTPPVKNPHLVWSPVNSRQKLTHLINEAKERIQGTSGTLGDPYLRDAFAAAAQRGVRIQLLLPSCSIPSYRHMQAFREAGVDLRVIPLPYSEDRPYMHGKMLLVDGGRAYVGSINFSLNSINYARELGIIFENPPAITQLQNSFTRDWSVAVAPPTNVPQACLAYEQAEI